MGFDTATITVDGSARTYKRAFVPKYAKQIASGNTACLKADITDGQSILRISHESVGNVQRHLVSVEDITVDTDGVQHIEKTHRVLSCAEGDPTAETRLENLDDGFDSYLATAGLKTSIVNGEL